MKLTLVASDFYENTITLRVPESVDGKRLHYHLCEIEVDLSEFLDDHEVPPAVTDEGPHDTADASLDEQCESARAQKEGI